MHFRGAIQLVLQGQWAFGASAAVVVWVLMSLLSWCGPLPGKLPAARARETGVGSLARIRSLAKAMFRTFRGLTFRGGYVLLATVAIALPGLLFAGNSHPRRVVDTDPFSAELVHVPFLAFSVLLMALGWRRFNKPLADQRKQTHVYAALFAGLPPVAFLVLWDLRWIESLTTAFWLSTGSLAGMLLLVTARMGSPGDSH
jgi:hypothetical protein